MTNRYLVVSDLHLCDIEDHPDGWKRHKSSRFVYDDEFNGMVADFVAEARPGDTLTLVLNGDIFDFDLVTEIPADGRFAVRSIERLYGMDATEQKSAWKLARMLQDHPVFVAGLAKLIAAGHRVVLIAGNHDREFFYPAVQSVLVDAVREALHALGHHLSEGDDQLMIAQWFFYVPGEIYIEHGHQYDFYSAYRYNLDPTVVKRGETIMALPMGNLSNRYLLSNMGTFNPHATDFILSLGGYIRHWLKHYAFTRRSILFTWLFGSFRALFAMLGTRRRLHARPPQRYDERKDAEGARFGISAQTVRELYNLRIEPITSRVFKMVREFWIDRLVLALLMTSGTIALALSPIPLWIKLMVPLAAFPTVWFIFQWFAGTDTALSLKVEGPKNALEIAKLLPARAVVFGHTHEPTVIPLAQGITFVNCGTWAPTWDAAGALLPGLRNYAYVAIDGGHCETRLGSRIGLPRQEAPGSHVNAVMKGSP